MDCAQVIQLWQSNPDGMDKNLVVHALLHYLECRDGCVAHQAEAHSPPRFVTSHAVEQIAPLLEP